MAIEWEGRDRGTGTVDVWTVVEPGPDGTEFYAEVGPLGFDALWFCAWRRKMTMGEAVGSQITVQLSAEGVTQTAAAAKATAERAIHSLQQIAHDNPGMLQTLHSAASEDGNQQGSGNGSGTQAQSR